VRVLGLVEIHRSGPPKPFGEIRRLLRLLSVDHVVDVGANHGQYAAALRGIGFAGRIDCIEPQPRCAEELRRRGDVYVHEVAVGAEPGEAALHVYRDDSLSSLNELNQLGRTVWDDPTTADEVAQLTVPVMTLNDLLDRLPVGRRVWMKLDTQGSDLDALEGLGDTYAARVVGLQTEVAFTPLYNRAPDPWQHLEALSDWGFALAGLSPIGRVDSGAITEADCFLIRR
jgi:FkbM family methyltransferase